MELREITDENVWKIGKLHVSEAQSDFVENGEMCEDEIVAVREL